MTRSISATNITESEKSALAPVVFAFMDFAGTPVFVNTSPMTFTFGGDTYLGVGQFGGISVIQETDKVQATSFTLSLSGVDSANITDALTETYQGRDCIIYLGYVNASHALVDDPFILARGRMDTMPIKLDKESVITMQVESRLADFFRPRVRRFNNQDQQERFPNDDGLEFTEQMVDKELVWHPK